MPRASTGSTHCGPLSGISGVGGAMLCLLALAALVAFGQHPAAAQRVASVVNHDVPEPRNGRIVFCHGYGCFFRSGVQFGAGDLQHLRSLLAGTAGPEAERAAISKAVQWFARRVGRELGTAADRPRSPPAGANDPTQLDCIDHTLNTMHLMRMAEQNGWLRHHAVDRPRSRGFFLDGRYPHNTAVIRERGSGARWAVDSWPPANGEPPDIMPLDAWLQAR